MVASLLGRELKSSNLPGRKEGKREKKCKEWEKKGKKRKKGKERTGKGRRKRQQKGGKLGKKNKMCKKKQNCLACCQVGENSFEPWDVAHIVNFDLHKKLRTNMASEISKTLLYLFLF